MVNSPTNSTSQDRKPVYIAFKTFLTALETLEQGVPPIITRYLWGTFSGSLQTQTFSAFKFLGLLDENGNSQPILQKIIDAKGDTRKIILRELIEQKYADAIKLGESNATFQQLQELFRGYGVTGGTNDMAVRFFTDACTFTGLKCSPHWSTAKKTRRTTTKKEILPPKIIVPPKQDDVEKKKAEIDLHIDTELHPMLLGLIKELPKPGSILDKQKRDSLQKYFNVVLDILYKSTENTPD